MSPDSPVDSRHRLPGEDLGSGPVEDPQAIGRLGHVQGLKQRLRPDLGILQRRNVLRNAIQDGMSGITRPDPEKLDGKVHGSLLLGEIYTFFRKAA
ncbi:hypothetical protein Mext_0446 [Methylorubrum extorquens PA1]|nr:hypothetical protein Mext_0446 [Methylorubrum extorquens PA1]